MGRDSAYIMEMFYGSSRDGMETHESIYYRRAWEKVRSHYGPDCVVVDPFARNCVWGTITNDLNPDTRADHHLDALDFMRGLDTESAEIVLFDPPFSPNQAEAYGEGMSNIYTQGAYMSDLMREIERVLRGGGRMLKLGYNSTKHRPTFVLERVTLVNFGGNRNDVIVTQWMKSMSRLDSYGIHI